MVEPLVASGRRAQHAALIDEISAGLSWYRSGEAWAPHRGDRPRYADDVAWLGLALAARAEMRRGPLPPEVYAADRFVRSCEHAGGGVRWHEAAESRNTCSTAPGAHLSLIVCRETGDPEALAFARRSLAWLDATLRRDDGLYGDHLEGAVVDPTPWAYNQGEAFAAWTALADVTGDTDARSRAVRLADATVRWLAAEDTLWRQPQVFAGIGVRNLLGAGEHPELHDLVRAHLQRIESEALAGDGFPTSGGVGRYDDDPAIDLAGIVHMAASLAAATER